MHLFILIFLVICCFGFYFQGAITCEEKLTEMGKMLSKLPVDILLGKMLIMGSLFYQVEPILSLASALSVQSPFTNRAFRDLELQVFIFRIIILNM